MPYRTIIAALLMAPPCASGQQEWKIQTDVVIYEAVVAGTTIKVVVSNSWGQVIHSSRRSPRVDQFWTGSLLGIEKTDYLLTNTT
jgi:hypothetical protein